MEGILADAVNAQQVGTWLLIAFLVAFFAYKEWPEFKKRVSGKSIEEKANKDEAEMIKDKVDAILNSIKEIASGQRESNARISTLEKETELQRTRIEDSLEERRLLMQGVMACLDGLQQQGCNHTVPRTREKLEEYLNKKAHD